MLKELSVKITLINALKEMIGYAKFMKDLVARKWTMSYEHTNNVYHCSAIASRSLV